MHCLVFCPYPRAHIFVCSLYALSKSSALSKMGRLWALTFTPVIVMTFEFCQRGATVDTPFLTVLKTWTSPLAHSVILFVCVSSWVLESLGCAPCLRISRLDCSVFGFGTKHFYFCLEGREMACWPSLLSTGHRLWFPQINGRSALYLSGRHFI